MSKVKFRQFKGGPFNLVILLIFLVLGLFALQMLTESSRSTKYINYSEFLKKVNANQVQNIYVNGKQGFGKLKDVPPTYYEVTLPDQPDGLWQDLQLHNVEIAFASPTIFTPMFFLYLLSVLTGLGIFWIFYRQSRNAGGGGGNIFSVGKSKARMFMPSQIKVNFNSVAGAQEAKEELKDVVDFLKDPEKYKKIGAKLTKGILLVGEPGNGKTLLARAVAGEANCPFFSISGSDFIEVFVGVGAARVRDLFAQARKNAPCIIFIDEIDAVGRQRGVGSGGGHDEREQTLNQLLTEMDGFDTAQSAVVVMAATNRPDVLDKALLRPGRFDRQVIVPYPDLKSREEILRVHVKSVKLADDVDLPKIARASVGMTGADIANLINEAAITASRNNQSTITMHDFEKARDRLALGAERRSIVQTPEDLKVTAYHESGHALINLLLPLTSDPLHKLTITPRGGTLGVAWRLPLRDKYSISKQELESDVLMALGGRAAEELVFNEISVGASSDFQQATKIIRNMVCVYGMSDLLGQVDYASNYRLSEDTKRQIDEEVRSTMKKFYAQAIDMLRTNRDKLDILATALLEKETLYAEEIYPLLNIEPRETHKIV